MICITQYRSTIGGFTCPYRERLASCFQMLRKLDLLEEPISNQTTINRFLSRYKFAIRDMLRYEDNPNAMNNRLQKVLCRDLLLQGGIEPNPGPGNRINNGKHKQNKMMILFCKSIF